MEGPSLTSCKRRRREGETARRGSEAREAVSLALRLSLRELLRGRVMTSTVLVARGLMGRALGLVGERSDSSPRRRGEGVESLRGEEVVGVTGVELARELRPGVGVEG